MKTSNELSITRFANVALKSLGILLGILAVSYFAYGELILAHAVPPAIGISVYLLMVTRRTRSHAFEIALGSGLLATTLSWAVIRLVLRS